MNHASTSRYAPDRGLSVRMGITIGLLAAVFLAIVVALISVGVSWRFVLGVAVSVVALQWVFADQMVIAATGARVVSVDEAPVLHAYIDRLCAAADLPKPRIAIADSDLPNAFAAGVLADRSLVCFTTGLLDRLAPEEFEAVAAHELSHIAHRDVLVMTFASTASVISGFLMRLSALAAAGTAAVAMTPGTGSTGGTASTGRRTTDDKDDGSGYAAMFFLLAVSILVVSSVVYAVNVLMLLALSRYRELAADRAAVLLTGKPGALASALTTINASMPAIPTADLRTARSISALSCTPAVSAESSWGWLLSTHPTLQRRLDNIAATARQLGGTSP